MLERTIANAVPLGPSAISAAQSVTEIERSQHPTARCGSRTIVASL